MPDRARPGAATEDEGTATTRHGQRTPFADLGAQTVLPGWGPGTPPPPPANRFHHEAVLFEDDADMLDRCVPFLLEGIARAESTVVVVTEQVRLPLLAALGDAAAARLGRVDAAEVFWVGRPRTVLAWAGFFSGIPTDGPMVRVVAEPFWLGLPGQAGWHRVESAANRFFCEVPCHCLCLYDGRRLPVEVLGTARRTHPRLTDGTAGRRPVTGPSPAYLEPERLVPTMEPPWTAVPDTADVVEVASTYDARSFADTHARRFGLGDRAEALVLAVSELAANALRQRPTITLAAWPSRDTLLVEVTDDGDGGIDPLAGYGPPDVAGDRGRGLWLVRSLADDAAVRSGTGGSNVRVLFGRDVPPP